MITSKTHQLHSVFALFMLLIGCVSPKRPKPPDIIAPPTPPALEKTFGELHFNDQFRLEITYKNIRILVDPQRLPSGSEQADYVCLSRKDVVMTLIPHLSSDHRQQKFIGPPDGVTSLMAAGFSQVKTISSGQRLMLQKEGSFLFVTVVQSPANSFRGLLNAYFFEFDNGRRIFIADRYDDNQTLRPFLYELRDDGQQTDIMVLNGSLSVEDIAEKASLFQPTVLILVYEKPQQTATNQREALDSALREQIFTGAWFSASTGFSFPF